MLVYVEDFTSPRVWQTTSSGFRVGGVHTDGVNAETHSNNHGKWHSSSVPYLEVRNPRSAQILNDKTKKTGIIDQSATYLSNFYSNSYNDLGDYVDHMIFVPRSKKLCLGVFLNLEFPKEITSQATGCHLEFSFRSYLENSTTYIENFRVNIHFYNNEQHIYGQAASASFTTGGSGYPGISSTTIYYDFTKPIWLWCECDMISLTPGSEAPVGNARVLAGNDVLASKTGILTGNVNAWPAQPWYEMNNVCVFRTLWSRAYDYDLRKGTRIYGFAVTNEERSYQDTSLGDIDIATLAPVGHEQSSFSPYNGNDPSILSRAEILSGNRVLSEFSSVPAQPHVRATEDAEKDLHHYDHPFDNDTHIFSVVQATTFRKRTVTGDASRYRLEPLSKHISRSQNNAKSSPISTVLKHVKTCHVIPYTGAFWSSSILHGMLYGYANINAIPRLLIADELFVFGEYDAENLSDEMLFSCEAIVE